jgi:hypothetical protein
VSAGDEDACGGFDVVVSHGFELIDAQYSLNLGKEAFEESEIAARDAFGSGDGLCR